MPLLYVAPINPNLRVLCPSTEPSTFSPDIPSKAMSSRTKSQGQFKPGVENLIAVLRQMPHRGKVLSSFQFFFFYLLPVLNSLTVFKTESIQSCRGNRCDDKRAFFMRSADGIKQIHFISDMKFACIKFDQRTATIVTPREFRALVADFRI